MSAVIANIIQAIDEELGGGFAKKNPSLIGSIAIADSVNALSNNLLSVGEFGSEYNVIDNIARALYGISKSLDELNHTVSCIPADMPTSDLGDIAVAVDDLATQVKEGLGRLSGEER
jgi:hypothetical protein